MRHNEVIDLLTVTYATDPLGNQIETEIPRTIFANEFGVSSSEFYDAAAQGLKPENNSRFIPLNIRMKPSSRMKVRNIASFVLKRMVKKCA